MTEQEATNIITEGRHDYAEIKEALDMSIKALELEEKLIKEIPTFKHIIATEYEMFNRYDLKNHTELERLCFKEFVNIVQTLQWLVDELESEK